jgi:hypothetical protein
MFTEVNIASEQEVRRRQLSAIYTRFNYPYLPLECSRVTRVTPDLPPLHAMYSVLKMGENISGLELDSSVIFMPACRYIRKYAYDQHICVYLCM